MLNKKPALFILCISLSQYPIAHADIPVIDPSSLVQSVLNVQESITQTSQMVQQYQTQLMQYENQLLNSKIPSQFLWDNIQNTLAKLQSAQETLTEYESKLGSLEAYLNQYQTQSFYKEQACFNGQSCTKDEIIALKQSQAQKDEQQKTALNQAFKGIKTQSQNIQQDATRLAALQNKTQLATGMMESLQYANQFAAQQNNQLLKMRELLHSLILVISNQMQHQKDQEAKKKAAAEAFHKNTIKTSDVIRW
jgi:P-type conjugative transfer protein TrbJ